MFSCAIVGPLQLSPGLQSECGVVLWCGSGVHAVRLPTAELSYTAFSPIPARFLRRDLEVACHLGRYSRCANPSCSLLKNDL
jgi:hypothetical protein